METPSLKLNPPIVGSTFTNGGLAGLIYRLAASTASVLITGESGTGKELVARNLHTLSRRRTRPFVAVNCAALSPGILESELFGHGRGAFTGAIQAHAGLFEQADGGTIFLDEIGEVPLSTQAKLLRVLQERRVRRIGTSETRPVDVRVVSATNTDLERQVSERAFRLDLFFRLNVVEIPLVPLRERTEDLFELIAHFFEARGYQPPEISDETREIITAYDWPGNVRELENEVERILALHPRIRRVSSSMLSRRIVVGTFTSPFDVKILCEAPLPRAVGYLEENLLRKTLTETKWNKTESAKILGLSRQGLDKKIKRYGIAEASDPGPATDGEERESHAP